MHEPVERSTAEGAGAAGSSTQVVAPRKISVLHLLHTVAYGGIETVLLNWLENFDRERFDIHVVCFDNPGGGGSEKPFVEAANRRGIHVEKIPWGRRKPILKSARALTRIMREHGVDVLHMHGWYADFVGALAARLTRVKTINTVYVWFDYDWKRNTLQLADQYIMRLFDQISAHCEFTFEETVARGIPAERVKTLSCGFKSAGFEELPEERLRRRRERGVSDDEILLLNVARLYPEKTHDALLRIFRDVHLRHPQTRLWIAGTGPLEQEVRDLAGELGLEGLVQFKGFVNDLPPLLNLADIQVHPAAIEGVPLAVLSGMDAGLPVVASEVGGIAEILDHGRSGILVTPGDDAGFVAAVNGLLADPAKCLQLGERGRAFVRNDYSLERAVREVEQTYEALVGR